MRLNGSRNLAPWLAVLFLAAWLALPAPAQDCISVREKYEGKTLVLQHNLRFDDDEARWVNFIGAADYLDVGTKVTVTLVKSDGVSLAAEGKGLTIKLDLKKATPSCAMILERIEDKLPGVLMAEASYHKAQMVVEFEETQVSEAQIQEVVRRMGYEVAGSN